MKTRDEFMDSVYEKYEIARAEEESAKRADEVKAAAKRKKLYKYVGTLAACLVLGVGLISTTGVFRMGAMASDSAANETASSAPMDMYTASDAGATDLGGMYGAVAGGGAYKYKNANDMVAEMEYDEEIEVEEEAIEEPGEYGTSEITSEAGSKVGNDANKEKKDLKLIYRANLNVQTTDFDKTMAQIKELVEKYDGYIESQQVYNGGYFADNTYQDGSYTVRIPQENYRAFLSSAGEDFFISNLQESIEDIGQAYYDAESHIKTLKIKEERLQGLLKQAEQMADIIEIENALSDTEHELEMYQSTLENYDSLIGYSTITIFVEKVTQFVNGVNQELSFFEKLGRNFKNGAINFGEGFENFVMWLGYNILPIIFIFVILFVFIRFDLIGKIGKLLGRLFSRKNR